MSTITVALPVDIEQFLDRLTPKQQQIISDKLWAIRVERISQKMRVAAKKNKVTPKDVLEMCKRARQKTYAKYRH